jgi:hypothetical protein
VFNVPEICPAKAHGASSFNVPAGPANDTVVPMSTELPNSKVAPSSIVNAPVPVTAPAICKPAPEASMVPSLWTEDCSAP